MEKTIKLRKLNNTFDLLSFKKVNFIVNVLSTCSQTTAKGCYCLFYFQFGLQKCIFLHSIKSQPLSFVVVSLSVFTPSQFPFSSLLLLFGALT